MKVIVKLELNDETLSRIRASYGRAGKATRKESRVWLDKVISGAVCELPEPKSRRRLPADTDNLRVTITDKGRDFAAAMEAPLDAVCVHCGQTKDAHGKMGFTCMPTATSKGGKMFKAQTIQGKAGGDAQNL